MRLAAMLTKRHPLHYYERPDVSLQNKRKFNIDMCSSVNDLLYQSIDFSLDSSEILIESCPVKKHNSLSKCSFLSDRVFSGLVVVFKVGNSNLQTCSCKHSHQHYNNSLSTQELPDKGEADQKAHPHMIPAMIKYILWNHCQQVLSYCGYTAQGLSIQVMAFHH